MEVDSYSYSGLSPALHRLYSPRRFSLFCFLNSFLPRLQLILSLREGLALRVQRFLKDFIVVAICKLVSERMPCCVLIITEHTLHTAASLKHSGLTSLHCLFDRFTRVLNWTLDPVLEFLLLHLKVLNHIIWHSLINTDLLELFSLAPLIIKRSLFSYIIKEGLLTNKVLFIVLLRLIDPRRCPGIKHLGSRYQWLH